MVDRDIVWGIAYQKPSIYTFIEYFSRVLNIKICIGPSKILTRYMNILFKSIIEVVISPYIDLSNKVDYLGAIYRNLYSSSYEMFTFNLFKFITLVKSFSLQIARGINVINILGVSRKNE